MHKLVALALATAMTVHPARQELPASMHYAMDIRHRLEALGTYCGRPDQCKEEWATLMHDLASTPHRGGMLLSLRVSAVQLRGQALHYFYVLQTSEVTPRNSWIDAAGITHQTIPVDRMVSSRITGTETYK